MLETSKDSGFSIPIISGLRVRNKILVGFSLVVIVFGVGMVVSYDASQTIANTNEQVLDRFAIIRAKSYELSLNFEEQKAFMRAYTIGLIPGMKEAFTGNINDIDAIASTLENLTEGTTARSKVQEIQDQRPLWIGSVVSSSKFGFSGVTSLPDQRMLSNLSLFVSQMSDVAIEIQISSMVYMLTGDGTSMNETNDFRTQMNSLLSLMDSQIAIIEPINTTYYTNYNNAFNTFKSAYNTWDNDVIGSALLLGDNNTAIVAAGDEYLFSDWAVANGSLDDILEEELEPILEFSMEQQSLTKSYLATANNNLAPILEDLAWLRDFSEIEMEKLKAASIAAITTSTVVSFAAIAIGIVLAILIALLIANSLSKPLIRLTNTSKIIADGDLTNEIEAKYRNRKDEIGALSENFNDMVTKLREVVSNIISTSTTLATSSQEMASSAEEVNATSEEISSITQQMSRGAQDQSTKSSQSAVLVDELQKNFNEKVANIESLSKLIEEITGKVNMLALNASIEAARAGEYGRGFAVVAENIRQLAEEGKNSVSKVNEITADLRLSLESSIKSISSSIQEVASISEETASGSEEASAATEEQAATMQEMSSTAQELANIATDLGVIVKKFKTE
ncbi:MAG: Methyl-accepting chemotaxis protein McpB [Candidatus Heimdallarchaeota archaeon LC_3]|nr:MAG: Methyl-accepting chemotaxis protein McpB [Candidatus Heimdallarchaeota archaeon LC_3]